MTTADILHAQLFQGLTACIGAVRAGVQRRRLSETATSCADVEVHIRDFGRIRELLRVLHLLCRPGVRPEALHDLLRLGWNEVPLYSDDNQTPVIECPLPHWCSFCDGEDRQLRVTLNQDLDIRSLVALLTDDLDDATATPEFRAIQALAMDIATANNAEERASPPISLSLCLAGRTNRPAEVSEIEALQVALSKYSENAAAPLFRIVRLTPAPTCAQILAAIATSEIPLTVDDGLNQVWNDNGNDLLITSNITRLEGVGHFCNSSPHRVLEVLRKQPTSLRRLELGCRFLSHSTSEIALVSDALFSRGTALQLDHLTLVGGFDSDTLRGIVARLSETQPQLIASGVRRVPLRSLQLKEWSWSNEDHSLKTALLEKLLHAIGGVESLRISGGHGDTCEFRPVDVCAIRSCRHLDVALDTPSWPRSLVTEDVATTTSTQVRSLRLRLGHCDRDTAHDTIAGLLACAGPPLLSLDITGQFLPSTFSSETACAIVRACPNLESLHVRTVDGAFVEELVESLATSCHTTACRLEHLTLRFRHPEESVDALLTALQVSTHPLTRSLRSLRLSVDSGDECECNCDCECCVQHECECVDECDVKEIVSAVEELLAVNKQLRDVTIQVVLQDRTIPGGAHMFGAVLPPLRHRLALLSAVRRHRLPPDALQTVLEMASRQKRRLRVDETCSVVGRPVIFQ